MRRYNRILAALLGALLVLSTAQAQVPRLQHVFVLVEENQSYKDVIGNAADMPYLNSLAQRYGLATNYFADTHPSINNYFYLTAGRQGTRLPFIGASADLYPFDVDGPNIASILTANGKTWKAYAESLPRKGYIGDDHGDYVKRHNPFAYFETVRSSEAQRGNIVPFRQLQADLQHHSLPDYGFIVPNIYNDGHNDPATHSGAACGDHAALQRTDSWLRKNIQPLIASPDFQQGGLLVITFDEACDQGSRADSRLRPNGPNDDGGGQVATVLVSSSIAAATISDRLFHHESVARLALEALGVHTFPGLAAGAPDMSAFFSGSRSPSNGSALANPPNTSAPARTETRSSRGHIR